MPAEDHFKYQDVAPAGPINHAFTISPSDQNDLPHVTRSIYVGTGGDLAVVTNNGETVIYKNLPSGYEKQGEFKKVLVAGTTAEDLIGEY